MLQAKRGTLGTKKVKISYKDVYTVAINGNRCKTREILDRKEFNSSGVL